MESGKPEIEQHHVRTGCLDHVNDLQAVTGFGNDLVAMSFQSAPQPVPDDLVIFGNDDSSHLGL